MRGIEGKEFAIEETLVHHYWKKPYTLRIQKYENIHIIYRGHARDNYAGEIDKFKGSERQEAVSWSGWKSLPRIS